MENEYETEEIWYPYHGGGEMKEIPYNSQEGLPPCAKDSKLVTLVKE
jgi:hypothetical protein